jgi:hypothetical protein
MYEMKPLISEELIVLKSFDNSVEAAMAEQLLLNQGLKAFVLKDDGRGMEPHLQLTRGCSLVVNRIDAKQAEGILQSISSGPDQ